MTKRKHELVFVSDRSVKSWGQTKARSQGAEDRRK